MVARHIPIERSGGVSLPKWKPSPRTWFLLEGVALTLLGVLAFALPIAAGLAAALVFGWLLVLGGGISLVSLVRTRRHANVGWRLVSAIAAVVAGVLALVYPWVGAWTLALLAAAYFFVTGVALAMVAVKLKRIQAPGWYWLLAPAAVDLALGVLAVFVAPVAAPLFIGYLVGVDLMFSGLALIAFAASRRRDAWS